MSKQSRIPCKSVLITFHGDTTHATLLTGYDHDTRTRSAWAKRNHDDPYDAYEGARVALARLFGKDPFPEAPMLQPKRIKEFRVTTNFTPVYEDEEV